MSHTPPQPNFDRMREDLEAKQRATLYPDTVRANRNVTEFLWNGDAKETKVQRTGLGIFALAYIFLGLLLFCVVFSDASILLRFFCVLLGMVFLLIGARFGLNAFRRKKNQTSH